MAHRRRGTSGLGRVSARRGSGRIWRGCARSTGDRIRRTGLPGIRVMRRSVISGGRVLSGRSSSRRGPSGPRRDCHPRQVSSLTVDAIVGSVTAKSVADEAAAVLKAVLGTVPPGGSRRLFSRRRRETAYLAFQSAALDMQVQTVWLGVAEEVILSKDLTTAQVWPAIIGFKAATSAILAALSEIRLVGRPGPRAVAEEIASLIGELHESRPASRGPQSLVREAVNHVGRRAAERVFEKADRIAADDASTADAAAVMAERFPPLGRRIQEAKDALGWEQAQTAKSVGYADCQKALGSFHRKFTLAARKDLGYGPHFWQVSANARTWWWQVWRQPDQWPGGWPGPDAKELIAGSVRNTRAAAASRPPPQGSTPKSRGSHRMRWGV
jgi:hypothetical protein